MPEVIAARHAGLRVAGIARKLKVRAAQAGMTLSDYLLAEIRRSADVPTTEEIVARVRSGRLAELKTRPADIIRGWRDAT